MYRKWMVLALGGMLMASPVLADNKPRYAGDRQADDAQAQNANNAKKVPTPSELEKYSRSEAAKRMKEAVDARNNDSDER